MIDTNSTTWAAIERAINDEIEVERKILEGQIDMAQTQFSRGKIAGLRFVQNLAKPRPQIVASQLDEAKAVSFIASGRRGDASGL